MDRNDEIEFEDISGQVDRTVSFWDVGPMSEERPPLIPRKTPWKPSEFTPPNFTRSTTDPIPDLNGRSKGVENTRTNVMDSKTERILWILSGVIVVSIFAFFQRDFVIGNRIERIKKDVEFRGKENEITRSEMRSGQESWVQLFSAQQQTNNLLTQSLLETKESVGTLDKKVSTLGAKTDAVAESAKTLDRTAQSMNEMLRSFSSNMQSKSVVQKPERQDASIQGRQESTATTPKITAKSVTISSSKPPVEPVIPETMQPLEIDGIEVSMPPEKPKKKYRFWNPLSWWGSEKPRTLTHPYE